MVSFVERELSSLDYVVFAGMLLISALIGVFYAYRDRQTKQGTAGYLMANRSMGYVPVAISLAVSFQSSITVLGVPADVYQFGMMYVWTVAAMVVVCVVVSLVFIPTLYSLGISSAYEYLEKRFGKGVRLTTTVVYLLQNSLYMGLNIYGPALALSGVTGFPLVSAMLSTGLVCIFYTTLGGLKGVIWTDVFQGIIMLVGMLVFIVRGSIAIGGFDKAWEIANEGGRLDIFRFDTDPRIRYTSWSAFIGACVLWVGIFGTNQAQVQRILSVKSQRKSIIALCLSAAGIAIYVFTAVACGIVLYAYYHDCDPLTQQCIGTRDQLMPLAVMDLFRDTHGLPGLFLACVFSSSLSTVSSGMNAMITVTIEDFIKPHTKWTEKQYKWASMGFGIVYGAVTLGISFLASVLGDIVTVGIACVSTFVGPSLGLFLLGFWCPFVNSIGAEVGFLVGVSLGMVMFFGGRSLNKSNYFVGKLDVSSQYCPENCGYMDSVNITLETATLSQDVLSSSYEFSTAAPDLNMSWIENFFALSFFYTACVGLAGTLLSGIVASILSGGWKKRHEVDHRLIRPPFESKSFSWLSEKIRSPLRCGISWTDPNKLTGDKLEEDFECKEMTENLMDRE